ncbi:hypothetical protein [Mucilaginibacter sp. PAMB04168]
MVLIAAHQSDGFDFGNLPLNATFKHGLFVVMSDDITFHYNPW